MSRRRETLLADPRISRWHKDHRTRSTAEVQITQLELFLRRTGVDLDQLLSLARTQLAGKSRGFEDLVLQWVESERKAGRPDSYVATNWAAIRSLLKHEECAPSWTPKLKVRFGTTIVAEVVPTPEQLRAVLDRAPVHRVRALTLVLATSGVRIGALGTRFDPPDGLRLRAFPELQLDSPAGPRFSRGGPIRIDIPAELSKAGNAYFTFASEEASEEIVAYLREREERGEKLTGASPFIRPEPKTSHVHVRAAADGAPFLNEKGLAGELRRALRRVQPAGVRWRPYVLRAFASSQLMLAENAQLITRDTREFLLGHSADIGRRYNLAKGRVRDDLVEEVRAMYMRAADRFLRVLTLESKVVDYRPLLRTVLAGVGYSKSEIDAMGELTEERVMAAIYAKRQEPASVPEPRPGDNPRTVAVGDLDTWLAKGWRPIAPAGSERFVVGAPSA